MHEFLQCIFRSAQLMRGVDGVGIGCVLASQQVVRSHLQILRTIARVTTAEILGNVELEVASPEEQPRQQALYRLQYAHAFALVEMVQNGDHDGFRWHGA